MTNQSLEEKFEEVRKEAEVKIKEHIERARAELRLAEQVSDETGIPFKSDVVEFRDRAYMPNSFDKWKDSLDEEFLENIRDDIGLWGLDKGGWEYWNSSSLSC